MTPSLAVSIVVAAREARLAELDVLPFAGGGHADLTGMLHGGHFIAIETRNGSARLSLDQWAYSGRVIDRGGFYLIASSVEEALRELHSTLEDIADTDAALRGPPVAQIARAA